jgi:type I restriction enzyme S subunit
MAVWSEISNSQLASGHRLDAEYYQPRYLADANKLGKVGLNPIGSFAFVTDGIHSSPDVVEEDGILYLSAKCVKDNTFALVDALHISKAQHAANPRTSLKENDVLITTVGTIGNAAVVQRDILPANADRHLGIIRIHKDSKVDPYYLATFLNCEYGLFQSLREATGNVQLNLFIEKIKELNAPLLPCADKVAALTREAYEKHKEAAHYIEAAESKLTEVLGLSHLDLSSQKCYSRSFSDLHAANRFGAEYFMPCKQRVLNALAKMPHRKIADVAPNVQLLWDPAQAAKAEKVRNYDLNHALEPFLDDVDAQPVTEIGSTKKRMQNGDVVISRLRSYLKEIAVVRTSDTVPTLGSSEFIVLRPKSKAISAETLMVYLRCPLVQTVLKWSQDGSNHPRFNADDLLAIPVPDAVLQSQSKIDALVKKSREQRSESLKLLALAKQTVEDMITGASARNGPLTAWPHTRACG